MSQELWDVLKVGGVAFVDFMIGGLTGLTVDQVYKPGTPYSKIESQQQFWMVFGITFLEIFFDGILAVYLRKLIYPMDMQDLTGGMFFGMPFLMTQPTLFRNLSLIWQYMTAGMFAPFAPPPQIPPKTPIDPADDEEFM